MGSEWIIFVVMAVLTLVIGIAASIVPLIAISGMLFVGLMVYWIQQSFSTAASPNPTSSTRKEPATARATATKAKSAKPNNGSGIGNYTTTSESINKNAFLAKRKKNRTKKFKDQGFSNNAIDNFEQKGFL